MKRKALIPLIMLVIFPILAFGLLSWKIMNKDRKTMALLFHDLTQSQLAIVDRLIGQIFSEKEEQFLKSSRELKWNPTALREFNRKAWSLRQVFALEADGQRMFPPSDAERTRKEEAFLQRTQAVWDQFVSRTRPNEETSMANPPPEEESIFPGTKKPSGFMKVLPEESRGWFSWMSGTRISHIFWRRDNSGRVLGFELDSVRFLSDLIALLPATDFEMDTPENYRIRLLDAHGSPIYQWGKYEMEKLQDPLERLPLSPPLGNWNLEYYGPGLKESSGYMLIQWITLMTMACLFIGGLGYFLYREQNREMKSAEQRVNFVNQVSHELKTPLTNIRLYAELLESKLEQSGFEEGQDNKPRHYLNVITSESQRLSRLISNVLMFSKSRKDQLRFQPRTDSVDGIIFKSLEAFKPIMESKGVRIETHLSAENPVEVDPEIVEQILNNLFSNLEKYGASGKLMKIESLQNVNQTRVRVSDHGPGIPAKDRQSIFEPFYRVGSSLNEGVTGTGIGLSISRQLAHLHGGDLVLIETEKGACFELRLHTPIEEKAP